MYDLTEIDKDRIENTFSDSGFALIDHKENEDKIDEYKRLYYKLRLLIDFKCERYDFINMLNGIFICHFLNKIVIFIF